MPLFCKNKDNKNERKQRHEERICERRKRRDSRIENRRSRHRSGCGQTNINFCEHKNDDCCD